MLFVTRLALVLCGLGLALPAYADDQAAFKKMLADPGEQQRVLATAEHSSVVLKNPCEAAQFTLAPMVSIQKPAAFDASGGILAGAWKQIVIEEGCGARRTLNVFLFVQRPHRVATVPMLPGTTRADLQLQQDAGRQVAIAAHVPEPNCDTAYVADTVFVKEEGAALPGAKGKPWQERWTVITCTRKIEVPVRFIPDSKGTTITAGPNTAVKVTRLGEKG